MPLSQNSEIPSVPKSGHNSVSPAQRTFDVFLASMALLALAPLMALIALLVCLESGRPVFFSQTRMGQNGRHFRLHKFRKLGARMAIQGAAVTILNDARMTRVGRLLAASKLDELPQFWNILVGDMSVVGPRPESCSFEECFAGAYEELLCFRPGLFGPNQTLFRNEAHLYQPDGNPEQFYRDFLFPLKARVDLTYFPHRTLSSDIACVAAGLLATLGLIRCSTNIVDVIADVEKWLEHRSVINCGQSKFKSIAELAAH